MPRYTETGQDTLTNLQLMEHMEFIITLRERAFALGKSEEFLDRVVVKLHLDNWMGFVLGISEMRLKKNTFLHRYEDGREGHSLYISLMSS